MRQIVLIIHNVRSAHNVGSLLRTADGLGVDMVIISGYSPYPVAENDPRLPHLAQKTANQIAKTALGAEKSVAWRKIDDLDEAIRELATGGFTIVALEQTKPAIPLNSYSPPDKIVLLVGNEITGIDERLLEMANSHLMIPMLGDKESFNVAAAAAMALYHIRYS